MPPVWFDARYAQKYLHRLSRGPGRTLVLGSYENPSKLRKKFISLCPNAQYSITVDPIPKRLLISSPPIDALKTHSLKELHQMSSRRLAYTLARSSISRPSIPLTSRGLPVQFTTWARLVRPEAGGRGRREFSGGPGKEEKEEKEVRRSGGEGEVGEGTLGEQEGGVPSCSREREWFCRLGLVVPDFRFCWNRRPTPQLFDSFPSFICLRAEVGIAVGRG